MGGAGDVVGPELFASAAAGAGGHMEDEVGSGHGRGQALDVVEAAADRLRAEFVELMIGAVAA